MQSAGHEGNCVRNNQSLGIRTVFKIGEAVGKTTEKLRHHRLKICNFAKARILLKPEFRDT